MHPRIIGEKPPAPLTAPALAYSEFVRLGSRGVAVPIVAVAPRPRRDAAPRAVRAATRRILLVEDDEDTRQLLAVALTAQGYDLAQSGTAEEGLARLRSQRFDLVLTDYDLPGKTGAAMLREAHAGGLLEDATTLIVTAHPDPEGVDEATLVRKPLDLALYISAASPPSAKARRNMEKLLSAFRTTDIGFAVYDLAQEPERAEADNVVFTPTLVKRRPVPRAWVLGDLSDAAVVTDLLHMCGIDPLP